MKKGKLKLLSLAHKCFYFKYFLIHTEAGGGARTTNLHQRKSYAMLRLSERIEIISTDYILNVYHSSLKLPLVLYFYNFLFIQQKLIRKKAIWCSFQIFLNYGLVPIANLQALLNECLCKIEVFILLL